MMNQHTERFLKDTGIQIPVICGAMYPCSNPELIAAVSEAGGIGIVQPVSMVFAHKTDFRAGLKKIKTSTSKPIGMNVITEKSSNAYLERMKKWLDIALEEGVRFFVTSLGNPKWIVDKVTPYGGIVYHDVVERKWAQKAIDAGVHGIICVNRRAGGHAGHLSPEELFHSMNDLGVPLICAGGLSTPEHMVEALRIGYGGVQLGTRFIATTECSAHMDYKNAIVNAKGDDIVLTEKISGVPVAIIKTPYIEKIGTKAGPIAKYFLKHPKYKHWMRSFYTLQSVWKLKKASNEGSGYKDYWQAGKSVDGIDAIEPSDVILKRYYTALKNSQLL